MLSKFNKEGIITGPLDSYCLLCENYLRDQNEINHHIAKPIHTKNLENVPYFEKYREDHIRKVKMGYYCEFCNKLFATAAKVGIHISENEHNQNKGLLLLKQSSNGVVAFGNILISDAAWNGIVDGTCTLCNTEFENESIHKTGQNHVLNLIKTNIGFAVNSVYRKIDEETFHCLTCNEVLAIKRMDRHFADSNHKSNLQKCDPVVETPNKAEPVNKSAGETKGSTGSIPKSNVNDSKKSSPAADKSANNPMEYDALLLKSMNAKDYIKTHGNEGNMYCILCEWILDQYEIPRHVRSEHHLTMLKMHKERLQKMSKVEEKPKELPKTDVKSTENDSNMNKVLESIPEFQKNDINIDLVSSTAVCKKCSTHLGMDYNAIKMHIEDHKAKPNKKDAKNPFQYNHKGIDAGKNTLYSKPVLLKRNDSDDAHTSRRSSVSSKGDEEIEAFAAQNNMRYSNRKVFCNLCKTYLPTAIKNLKEHINGANHKFRIASSNSNATTKVKSRNVRKVPIGEFVTSLVGIENMLFQDVVLNERLCVNVLSFMFIKSLDNTWKCYSCDSVYGIEEIENHKKSDRHRKAMTDAPVVVVDSEFIREVRSDVYHCGFCNIIESGWDDMESHLSSVQHKENKNVAEWRLHQHSSEIRGHEMRQKMQILAFMHMMAGNESSNDSDSDW